MIYIISGILIFITTLNINGQFKMTPKKTKPFRSGESLKYSLKYGPIHGGDAIIELKLVKYENKTAYHSKLLAKSVGITDKLFRVRDSYESYFDPKNYSPYKAIRNIREGNYTFYNEVSFHLEDSVLYSQISDSVFKVPPGILDMVSTLYFIRGIDYTELEIGDSLNILTFFSDEIFPFPIRYKGKEIIKTKLGKFRCLVFVPVVETGRIFESEDDMTIWISDDKNLIPIRVKFDLLIGSIKCDLSEYSCLKYDFKPLE